MDYGRAIKVARLARRLSQRQLGQTVGLDASYISRIEKGTRIPTLEALESLSRALSLPLHLLVLLAADATLLRSITTKEAAQLGQQLLALLTDAAESHSLES